MSGSSTLATTPSSGSHHRLPSPGPIHLAYHPVVPPSRLPCLPGEHEGGEGWGSRTSVSAHSGFSPPPHFALPLPPWSSPESKGMFWSLGRMGAPRRREEGEGRRQLRPVSVWALNRTQQPGWGNENKQPLSAALPDGPSARGPFPFSLPPLLPGPPLPRG